MYVKWSTVRTNQIAPPDGVINSSYVSSKAVNSHILYDPVGRRRIHEYVPLYNDLGCYIAHFAHYMLSSCAS